MENCDENHGGIQHGYSVQPRHRLEPTDIEREGVSIDPFAGNSGDYVNSDPKGLLTGSGNPGVHAVVGSPLAMLDREIQRLEQDLKRTPTDVLLSAAIDHLRDARKHLRFARCGENNLAGTDRQIIDNCGRIATLGDGVVLSAST